MLVHDEEEEITFLRFLIILSPLKVKTCNHISHHQFSYTTLHQNLFLINENYSQAEIYMPLLLKIIRQIKLPAYSQCLAQSILNLVGMYIIQKLQK